MRRRDFLKTAGWGAASLAVTGCESAAKKLGPAAKAEKPNIVFIVVESF